MKTEQPVRYRFWVCDECRVTGGVPADLDEAAMLHDMRESHDDNSQCCGTPYLVPDDECIATPESGSSGEPESGIEADEIAPTAPSPNFGVLARQRAGEIEILRKALSDIYEKAGAKLWKTRRRSDTSGHFCDYRGGLEAVKQIAKKALSHQTR